MRARVGMGGEQAMASHGVAVAASAGQCRPRAGPRPRSRPGVESGEAGVRSQSRFREQRLSSASTVTCLGRWRRKYKDLVFPHERFVTKPKFFRDVTPSNLEFRTAPRTPSPFPFPLGFLVFSIFFERKNLASLRKSVGSAAARQFNHDRKRNLLPRPAAATGLNESEPAENTTGIGAGRGTRYRAGANAAAGCSAPLLIQLNHLFSK